MEDKNTILRKWVDALRSGNYTQARGKLKQRICGTDNQVHTSYCALGVLCHIMVDGIEIEEKEDYFLIKGNYNHYPTWAHTTYIPKWIVNQLNIDQNFIARLNDIQGASFDIIADVIETFHLPKKENTRGR